MQPTLGCRAAVLFLFGASLSDVNVCKALCVTNFNVLFQLSMVRNGLKSLVAPLEGTDLENMVRVSVSYTELFAWRLS